MRLRFLYELSHLFDVEAQHAPLEERRRLAVIAWELYTTEEFRRKYAGSSKRRRMR